MSPRKIIQIDEAKCNGCGQCVTGCAEGALAIVDGKARLVRETYCDGFGDCIGACPTGALTIVEREAAQFDPEATRAFLRQTQGEAAVRRMDEANVRHERTPAPRSPAALRSAPSGGGCPGSMMRTLGGPAASAPAAAAGTGLPPRVNTPELRQWPVQLHLVPPGAPWFQGRELVVMSTCAPIASADVHWRFLRGRSVVVACPKLDRTDPYEEKLAAILAEPTIPRVLVVRMEVPCCGGLARMTRAAAERSGRTDLEVREVVVSLEGEVM